MCFEMGHGAGCLCNTNYNKQKNADKGLKLKTSLKEFNSIDELLDTTEDLLQACKMAFNHLAGDRPCHMAGLIKEKLKQAISKAEGNN